MTFYRDHYFDEPKKMRSAGIRGEYYSWFNSLEALKSGIVLELGFDQTTPNIKCNISSWAVDKALSLNLDIVDNRALAVKCYCPEYTLVEKLQTVSTKYRQQRNSESMPINFLRHYYDIYRLLAQKSVLQFIGTHAYYEHKAQRFRSMDEPNIQKNEAFLLSNPDFLQQYKRAFQHKSAIYFSKQPSFESILSRIQYYADML